MGRTWMMLLIGGLKLVFDGTGSLAYGDTLDPLPPLEWSARISPGTTQAELELWLRRADVDAHVSSGGLTYTSKVRTDKHDYLFCDRRLFALVEGGFYSGADFNRWFQAFLNAHASYGQPNEYRPLADWGQFQAVWELAKGNTLYYILRTDLASRHGWSRQLYNVAIGGACGGIPRK